MTKPTILIRCMQHRAEGTFVTLDGITYHFRPRPDLGAPMAHVCPVERKDHARRFLSVTEGYEMFLGDDDDEPVVPVVPDPVVPDPVEPATDPDAAAEGDGEGEGDDIEAPTDPAAQDDEPTDPATSIANLSDEDLRAEFARLNGRPAPPKTKRETLIQKIEELRAA